MTEQTTEDYPKTAEEILEYFSLFGDDEQDEIDWPLVRQWVQNLNTMERSKLMMAVTGVVDKEKAEERRIRQMAISDAMSDPEYMNGVIKRQKERNKIK